jgi:hypothetical protein
MKIIGMIALLIAILVGLVFTSSSGGHEENTMPPPWKYRMSGNLDDANLTCSGEVIVRTSGEDCWSWDPPRTECKGKTNVDWLHGIERSGKVCHLSSDWELRTLLPGNSFCIVHLMDENGTPEKGFELRCTWRCRERSFPCDGSATYSFLPQVSPSP